MFHSHFVAGLQLSSAGERQSVVQHGIRAVYHAHAYSRSRLTLTLYILVFAMMTMCICHAGEGVYEFDHKTRRNAFHIYNYVSSCVCVCICYLLLVNLIVMWCVSVLRILRVYMGKQWNHGHTTRNENYTLSQAKAYHFICAYALHTSTAATMRGDADTSISYHIITIIIIYYGRVFTKWAAPCHLERHTNKTAPVKTPNV